MADLDDTQSTGKERQDGSPWSAHVRVFDGERALQLELPKTGMLVIGRAAESDVVAQDRSVSRRHARISVDSGVISISDLDSHNGVRVNGEQLNGSRKLADGDVVLVGEVVLVLHVAAGASEPLPLEDPDRLLRRLAEEVERGLAYDRPLALLAISVGSNPPRAEVTQTVRRVLRRIDVVGWGEAAQLQVVLPEKGGAALSLVVDRLLAALRPLVPAVKVGLARCPTDGCDASTLLAAARAAAAAASSGGMCEAATLVKEIQLGERRVVVADPAMDMLFEQLRRIARSGQEPPVLITGENGAGKENAAFAVHFWSRRATGPFEAINCGALSETLVESELFGHEKGAFTGATAAKMGLFERADGGTVFLDEVGDLPLAVQVKLLRVLETKRILRVGGTEERKVDFRVIAATNRRLKEDVAERRFREDLYHRLKGVSVELPPLRERRREIGVLAERFLTAACGREGRSPLVLAPATLGLLSRYRWPGNVRELKNAMESLPIKVEPDEELVEPRHLPEEITAAEERDAETGTSEQAPMAASNEPERPVRLWTETLQVFERDAMAEALRATGGVKTRAAARIGMPMRTFTLKCKQYGL